MGDADASDPNGSTPDTPPPEALTLDEALDLAMRLHQSGQLDTAERIYERILEAAPGTTSALHYLGILYHQTGRSDRALLLIAEAVALEPSDPRIHNNLGNVLAELDRPEEAASLYRAALALDPGQADAHNNLGAMLRILGHLQEAEASYRDAITADAEHQAALDNLGRLLANQGRIAESILCHAKALELAPHDVNTRRSLVAAYAAAGERDAALKVIDAWLADTADDPTALHLRAAISGRDVPERASDLFVEGTFDRFASSFEVKLARLDYRAPGLVAAAVGNAYGQAASDLDVLDAGCGTGLCGPLLKPFAARLTGVDLSSKMLRQAEARTIYDVLCKAELTQFLDAHPDSFDLIASADTLCYFGALQGVIGAAGAALRKGGVLIFTVEEERDAVDLRLNPHGRYSHHADHVAGSLVSAGLDLVDMGRDTLRREKGEDVAGLIVTARKP